MRSLKFLAPFTIFLLATACHSGTHPNQLSPFDGATYDTLTASHSAITALSTQIATAYPKYKPELNKLATSYNAALVSYAAFRSVSNGDEAALQAAVSAVSMDLAALEDAIRQDLHPSPQAVAAAQFQATQIRVRLTTRAALAHISFIDVMTQLELAAKIAESIPVASPYAALAEMVLQATTQAVTAIQHSIGQPINLALIPAIPLLPL